MREGHLLMAAVLEHPHLNHTEQSTLTFLPFTDALLNQLSLFVSQMGVVSATYVADPAMVVRRHESIVNPRRQTDYP